MDNITNPPKVSVVIPLYNKAPYIARALDSVLAQTVQDYEVIIVGGRSSDNGEEIVKEYHDSRIYLIEERGRGVSEARNQGVDAARAELIAFLDADDEWLPQFLETIMQLREKYPEAGLYGTGYYVSSETTRKNMSIPNCNANGQLIEYYKAVYLNHHIVITCTSCAIPKWAFINLGGWANNMKWGEDRDLFCRIAFQYPVAYFPIPQAIYYSNTINNSGTVISNMDSEFIKNTLNMPKNEILSRNDGKYIYKYINLWLCEIARNYIIRDNNISTAKKYLKKAPNKLNRDWIITNIHILFPKFSLKLRTNSIVIAYYYLIIKIRAVIATK